MSNWKLEIDGVQYDLEACDDSESGAGARLAVWEKRNEIAVSHNLRPRTLRIIPPPLKATP